MLTELPESLLDAELPLVQGQSVKLADYAGKVVVLNFFATYCEPCKVEAQELSKLYEEFSSQGVVVIVLSIENPVMSSVAVRDWFYSSQLPYLAGWATSDFAAAFMGQETIPQTFVITRKSQILKQLLGYLPTTMGELTAAVKQAIESS